MKPSDLYAMPTLSSETWRRSRAFLAFLPEFEPLDIDEAKAGTLDLSFDLKLSREDEDGSPVTYTVAAYKDRPIGFVMRPGKFAEETYVTDQEAYEALRHRVWLCTSTKKQDVAFVDVDEDDRDLAGAGGMTVFGVGSEMRLVQNGHLSKAGEMLFDERAFAEAVDELVRPLEKAQHRMWDPDVREAVARAMARAVPEGLRKTIDFEKEDGDPVAFEGVLVGTEDGTYIIGIPRWGITPNFRWVENVRAEWIGDADGFDEVAVQPAREAEAGM